MSVPSKTASVFTALFLILFGCVFTGVGVMMFFMFEDTGSGIAEAIPTFIATMFTLAGLGIIGGAFYSIPHAAALRERAARYPDQPWMLNNAWATGRIRDGNTVTLIIMAIITVVWCGITAKVLISMLIDSDF
ncbi:MAG: hypothetical protein ACQKBW_05485, partial [Puniceicoccales bacterium]